MSILFIQLHVDMPFEEKKTSKLFHKAITYKKLLEDLEEELGQSLDDYIYVMWNGRHQKGKEQGFVIEDVAELKGAKAKSHCSGFFASMVKQK